MLSHPDWQKKRLEVMQRDSFTCRDCNSKDKELHVHHLYYVQGKKPQDYPLSAYKTLCFQCHELEEENLRLVGGALINMYRGMGASAKEINVFAIAVYDYLEATHETLPELKNILQIIVFELKKASKYDKL